MITLLKVQTKYEITIDPQRPLIYLLSKRAILAAIDPRCVKVLDPIDTTE